MKSRITSKNNEIDTTGVYIDDCLAPKEVKATSSLFLTNITKVSIQPKTKDNGKVKVKVKKPLYIRYSSCKFAELGKSFEFCKKSIPTKKSCKDIKTIIKCNRYFFKIYLVSMLIYFNVNLDFTSTISLHFNASIALII